MNVNINAKGLQLVKQRNVRKEWVYVEIEKLLGSSVNDNGDEVAQFEADRFISDRFCMVWPKQKSLKQTIEGPPKGVAFQEQMSCSSPYKMDNNHNRQGCGSLEDANRLLLGTPQNPQCNESKVQPVDLTEVKKKELDSLLKECFEAYHLGHYSLSATKYKMAWEIINNPTLKLRVEHIHEDVVCYMLCLSLLETNQLNNLSEAVELLVALEKRSSHKFPAVYYALSMAHHKHYRFALALKAAEEGLAFLDGDVKLIEQKIPGSDVTLEEFTKDGLSVSLAAMKDECSKWHPPDAVCCMGECLPSSRWYGPNRDIYFRDPAFNGMVVLTCSNTRNPCTMKFHQACWKMRKDQLSALKKLSDKDIIGYECFTPNCEYGQGIRSLITRVEVYGDDGKLKTHIEPPANPIQWMKRRSLPKGAIPKQQAKPKRQLEKIRRPVTTAIPRSSGKEVMGENRAEKAWRMDKLAKLRQNNFGIKPDYEWRPDVEMYGNPQMMEIGDFLGGPIFENDSPELVAIKTFIFDYFYQFIKENGCVKKIEISQKWEEDKFIFDSHSDVLHGETDICEFLLQSYKLVSLGDRIGIAANLPELYAIVRSEVCGCLKFLLADPLHSRLGHIQDDVSSTMINNSEKKQNTLSTVSVDSDAKIDRTVPLDKIQQIIMTPPVIVSPHFPPPECGAVISSDNLSEEIFTDLQQACENIDPNTWNVTSKNISSLTEQKSSNDSADVSESVALPVPSDYRLEPHDYIELEEIHDPNDYLEQSEDNVVDADSGTEPDNCLTSSQFALNVQKGVDIVELGVDSEEGKSDRDCNLTEDLELTNGQPESESNQDYHIYDSDSGDFKLDGTTDSMSEINRDRQQIELRVDVTVRKAKCIGTYNDTAEEAEPSGKETFADNAYMAATEFPNGSFKEQQDCVELKQTKTMETRQTITTALHTSQCQDTLAESNVQKIENDLAVMVKTVAQLKSLLEQNQVRSENHARILQQELLNDKMVSRGRMTELLKDLNRLETRCDQLELEKSEMMHKFLKCELDLRRINDENVGLTLKNTELMHKYDKLSEEKADIDNNFNLLLKEKSVIENNLEMVQKERDKMDKKLQKCHARLKDKSCADSDQISSDQKEQVLLEQMLDATRLNERKLKLQSLNHEFNINKYALEKAFEKCCDHITMLNDVCELVTLITGQQFIAGEVREAWQQTDFYLRHTIVQYKEDYLKLNALLESDKEIENLNDIKLRTVNIRFPPPPNLSELYRRGKAKLIRPQMPVLSSQWLTSGGHYPAPGYFLPTANAFYSGRNLETGVNDASNIAAGSVFLNNCCLQKFYHNDDMDSARQKGRSDHINGAEFQRNADITQSGPTINAETKPSVENLTFYDAQNDDEGASQASCSTNALEGAPQISINRRSSPMKKIGRDLLMQELRKKFVGVPELDLLESVQSVRRLHKDTLSGMHVQDIIKESEPFVMQLQAKHMAHYSPSKQMLPSERINLQLNKPNQRKLPSSMPLGQQKRIRGGNQEQSNKLANNPTKVPAVVPAAMKKPAWGPATTGRVEWKKNQEDSECSICFESMNVNDKRAPVYILPCQHSFHTTCIKKWLGETSVCPICRIHCTMDDEFPPLPS